MSPRVNALVKLLHDQGYSPAFTLDSNGVPALSIPFPSEEAKELFIRSHDTSDNEETQYQLLRQAAVQLRLIPDDT